MEAIGSPKGLNPYHWQKSVIDIHIIHVCILEWTSENQPFLLPNTGMEIKSGSI